MAAIALVQYLLVAQFIANGRNAAATINTSGAARMHSQRIAYLAAVAHFGVPEPRWRTEYDASLDALRVAGNRPGLAGVTGRYLKAATALERDPRAVGAFAEIRAERGQLLLALDAVTRRLAGDVEHESDKLRYFVLWSLALQLLTLIALVRLWIAPAEQRLKRALSEIKAEQAEVQSLFDQNPDGIAVYDRAGMLVRTNRARASLLGSSVKELLGRHCSTFIDPAVRAAAMERFERANRGEDFCFDTVLTTATGEAVDVQMSIFPHVVGGMANGVIAVSRDVRALRSAQAETNAVSRRLTALCEIASQSGTDWRHQVTAALTLAATQLDCEWGLVGETSGEDMIVLASAGGPAGIRVGQHIPLKESISQYILRSAGLWIVDDLLESPWREHNARNGTAWRSMVALKLPFGGGTSGTFAIAGAQPRRKPLSPADHDFITTVGALIASIVQRGQQNALLDSLAFSDPLTGLANRVCITRKLEELIAAAQQQELTFAVHFIDLDRFKQVNDVAGHAVGDEVLCEMARRFERCVRATDVVARLGGDEFLVLQGATAGRQGVAELADRLTSLAREPVAIENRTYRLGCSVGISVFPDDGADATTLLKRADDAMYRAKAERRSGAIFAA